MFLDDIDLMDIPSSEVRRRIGIVLQDFHVFSGSVADNISLGNPRHLAARKSRPRRASSTRTTSSCDCRAATTSR